MLKMEVVSKGSLETLATDFATDKILLKIRNPVSDILTGLYKSGADPPSMNKFIFGGQARHILADYYKIKNPLKGGFLFCGADETSRFNRDNLLRD